jgi:undecaprenyl-diphosphatase
VSDLEAIFLGLVQGLTEFLPVSSSGHLVMVQTLMGIHQTGLLFEIAVHVATLVSVLIFYRQRVAWLVLGVLRGRREALEYTGKLVVATLPAVIAVLLVGDFFEAQFEAPAVAGWLLMATGGILWTTRRTAPAATRSEISWADALAIGCAQVVAILPGISRSGTTVAAALALGVTPLVAAEFSFMMSVVAITGAAVRALPELGSVPASQVPALMLASATALVSGIAAIWLFVRLLRGFVFYRFAYYTWLAGGAFLVWLKLAG